MRIAIVGADDLAVATARLAIDRGHDVVIVERDKDRIDALSENMDCGFLHGDGSKPAILREADPGATEVLMSIGPDDQYNILASLVGRSLGFGRVITKITDPEFQPICTELGLEETVIPNSTMARTLADIAQGHHVVEASTVLRGDLHFFQFVADADTAGPIGDLAIPKRCSVIVIYRDDRTILPTRATDLAEGDQVVLLADASALDALSERFGGQTGA